MLFRSANSAVMNINQSSQRAVINWDSFNVGKNATVNFHQPNAQSVTLNRVVGATASLVNGAVHSNGQVVLVNPNGITFGRGAQVDAAAVVASTLDISNKEQHEDNYRTTFNGINNHGGIMGGSDCIILRHYTRPSLLRNLRYARRHVDNQQMGYHIHKSTHHPTTHRSGCNHRS